ncbi:MAG: hypothetical protein R2792_16750 [Saprospiraceae bacterium]
MKKIFLVFCFFQLVSTLFSQTPEVDLSFGQSGWVQCPQQPGSGQLVQAVATKADGGIIVSGNRISSNGGFQIQPVVWAFLPNGAPDLAFGTNGVAVLDLPFPITLLTKGLIIQDNGNILLSGVFLDSLEIERPLVINLLPDGSLDLGFGYYDMGFQDISIHSAFSSGVAVDLKKHPNGEVLVLNDVVPLDTTTVKKQVYICSLDVEFGTVSVLYGSDPIGTMIGTDPITQASSFEIEDDGSLTILMNATFAEGEWPVKMLLSRLDFYGEHDVNYGDTGNVAIDTFSQATFGLCSAMQADGKMVVGMVDEELRFKVARFETDGSLDETFGTGGFYYDSTTDSGLIPVALTVLDDGEILITATQENLLYSIALIQVTAHGQLDSDFGDGGYAQFDYGGNATEPQAFCKIDDSRFLVAGFAIDENDESINVLCKVIIEAKSQADNLLAQSVDIQIQPNPVSSHFTLNFSEEIDQLERVELLDQAGRIVQVLVMNQVGVQSGSQHYEINPDLPMGMYYLRVWTKESFTTLPLIKANGQ